jgi:F-type H+-transporting ATPase subunit epsilon
METFQLEFITPESKYFSGAVAMVEVPGMMGDFGVLAGHAPFISTIRPGVVSVHVTEGETNKIFVAGGIAEVNPSTCTILAERVIDISNISSLDALDRLNKARATLDNTFDETAKADAQTEVTIAEAILAAVS